MNPDDQDAALAHEQELERRRIEEELLNNPDYLSWLSTFYTQQQELEREHR